MTLTQTPIDSPTGVVTADPLYGITLTHTEARVLVDNRVEPITDNIDGDILRRTQACASSAIELSLARYNQALDSGLLTSAQLATFTAGFIEAVNNHHLGDYAFDSLGALDSYTPAFAPTAHTA